MSEWMSQCTTHSPDDGETKAHHCNDIPIPVESSDLDETTLACLTKKEDKRWFRFEFKVKNPPLIKIENINPQASKMDNFRNNEAN